MKYHEKPNLYIKHVQIKVADLQRSVAYYTSVIGFQVLKQNENEVILTTDGKSSILSLIQLENVAVEEVKTTGLYHFALLLPERSDLAAIVKHFQEVGAYFGASDHDVSEALYLQDPDNNGIEIYIDRDSEKWSWQEEQVYMTTEPLNFESLMSFETNNWTGLPEGTLMGHIHLHVADLQQAEAFYTALGYEVVCRYGRQALFISTGKYHHHIGLNTWNGVGAPVPAANSVGLESFTVQLDDRDEQIVERLQQASIAFEEITVGFKVTDPSGNHIIMSR
ncbi:VOC family protein [Viridibacillus sp. YIM B01967]|uniref:VOC family protein n=1 Tax=Viridibacillus soli TaxID=2798301 RepID=A0ABS1HA12_9BACL|nr:VOC family protein [Viridibacillus soli]MBK3496246.1 VOC family protein [Viridibacillus soli]